MKKQLLTLNGWLLLAGLVSFLSFSANAQRNNSGNKKPVNLSGTQQKRADIYLAGYSTPDGKTEIATYLKNGEPVLLAQTTSDIVSLAVIGNNVYAAGHHNLQGVYWKNGVEVQLDGARHAQRTVHSMAVDHRNGDVYIVGYERIYTGAEGDNTRFIDRARCWKNGQQVPLTTSGYSSYAIGVAIDYSTGDIYVMGEDEPTAKNTLPNWYWKNGEPVKIIDDPVPVAPKSIRILNHEIYITGRANAYSGDSRESWKYDHAAYWCSSKGTVLLGSGGAPAMASSIAVSGKDIYVAGFENGLVKYWKNGVPTVLSKTEEYPETYRMAVDGDDVYVAGWGEQNGDSGIRYWKNGQLAGTFDNFKIKDIVVARQGGNLVENIKPTPAVKEKQPVIAEPSPVTLTPKEEAEKFFAENKKKPGIITTPSGLQYEIISQGTGPKPLASDKVKFNFLRTLMVGKETKEKNDSHSLINQKVSDLIPGMAEGLQLMSVGSKYRLFIPAKLGYGESKTPGYTFIFETELLEILK